MRSVTIALIVLFLILPLASAATDIRLKTLSGHDVYISVWSPGMGYQIQPPERSLSDINGDVQYTYEGTVSPFDVLVVVKSFGVQKFREKFGPYTIGGVIHLPNLLPENFTGYGEDDEPPTNTTTNNTDLNNSQGNVTGNTTDNSLQNITGNEENTLGEFFTSDAAIMVYYVLGAIFLIAIIAAIIMFVRAKIRSPKNIQYGMEPVKLQEKPKYDTSGDKYLNNIEREIDNVERQIEQYKKRNRLEDAQKRLEEKKRILEKIKRGENVDYAKNSNSNNQNQKFKRSENTERYGEEHEHKFKKRFY